jgi:hypothetical protein
MEEGGSMGMVRRKGRRVEEESEVEGEGNSEEYGRGGGREYIDREGGEKG